MNFAVYIEWKPVGTLDYLARLEHDDIHGLETKREITRSDEVVTRPDYLDCATDEDHRGVVKLFFNSVTGLTLTGSTEAGAATCEPSCD